MRVLVATNNAGKVREYRQLLAAHLPEVEVLTLRDVGIDADVEESGESFEENARLKAVAYGEMSGLPVIADDSGIVVGPEGEWPGVYSNRWAGEGTTAEERNTAMLAHLAGKQEGERVARFVCVALCRTPDGREAVARGEVAGRIGEGPRGTHGFGYDPIFVLPDGRTMAELPPEEKGAISHRGAALRALLPAAVDLLRSVDEGE